MVKIPNRLEDLYPANALEMITDVLQQPGLSAKVREAIDRTGFREKNPLEQVQQAWQQARSWIESLGVEATVTQDTQLINASGQLFHEGIGGLSVNSTVARVLANSSIRFQHQPRCEERVKRFAKNSFGGKAVAWTTSVHAAMDAVVGERRLLIAKSDLLRIARIGDVSCLLDRFDLVEVGPANGCSEQDWRLALERARKRSEGETCIVTVSPNMLEQVEADSQRTRLLSLAGEYRTPICYLCADVVANEKLAADFGFPLITDILHSEWDAIVAPLGLLLGGQSGAIAVGREGCIAPAIQRADSRGCSLGPSEIAANMVALQLSMLSEDIDSGVVSFLLVNSANLAERARRMAVQLDNSGIVTSAEAVARTVELGPRPWDKYSIDNWAVRIRTSEQAAEVHRQLSEGKLSSQRRISPAVWTALDGDCLWVDLRFVEPKDDHLIVEALSPVGAPQSGETESISDSPEVGDPPGSDPG